MANSEIPEAIRNELEEGQRLRGWIVNAYAQVEYLLGDLILRCRAFSEYEEQTRTFTHSAHKRVAKVRAMLDCAGPLDPFAGDLRRVLDRFDGNHETRNLLTHGFCEFHHTSGGDTGFYFQKFHRPAPRDDSRLTRTFRTDTLIAERDSSSALAQEAMELFAAIHGRFGWIGRAG